MTARDPDQHWEDCPPGTLAELRRRALRAQRRELLKRIGTTSLVLAVAIPGAAFVARRAGWFGRPAPHDPLLGGVSCAFVRDHLMEYHDGRLDQQVASRIEQHLADCPPCAARLEEIIV